MLGLHMTIHSMYTTALWQHKDSISNHPLPKSDLLIKYTTNILRVQKEYKETIEANQMLSPSLLEKMASIQCNKLPYIPYNSSLPALLDPPLTTISPELSPLTQALLDKPYKQKNRDRSHFIVIREKMKPVLSIEKSIFKAHSILKYPLSTKLQIPPLTKEVALKALYGEENPFNNLTTLKQLGLGSYGQVLLVQTTDKKQYALKIEHKALLSSAFDLEYYFLVKLRKHRHIIKLLHIDKLHRALFLEFAANGTLRTDLEPAITLKALRQTSSTLHDLHNTAALVHSDIKMTNILIDHDFNIKIADFSLTFFKKDYIKKCWEVVPYYLPPELKNGKLTSEICEKIDVWSFGILIWTFLKKEKILTPINDQDSSEPPSQNWSESFEGFKGELKEQLDPTKVTALDLTGGLIRAMESCLHITPESRPSMKELTTLLNELDRDFRTF